MRLTRDDISLDADLRALLSRAYNLEAVADYETGPGSEVSPERARDAVGLAHRFFEWAVEC